MMGEAVCSAEDEWAFVFEYVARAFISLSLKARFFALSPGFAVSSISGLIAVKFSVSCLS